MHLYRDLKNLKKETAIIQVRKEKNTVLYIGQKINFLINFIIWIIGRAQRAI